MLLNKATRQIPLGTPPPGELLAIRTECLEKEREIPPGLLRFMALEDNAFLIYACCLYGDVEALKVMSGVVTKKDITDADDKVAEKGSRRTVNALTAACFNGYVDVVEVLVREFRMDAADFRRHNYQALSAMCVPHDKCGALITLACQVGVSPLEFAAPRSVAISEACMRDNVNALKALLACGLPRALLGLDVVTVITESPLQLACRNGSKNVCDYLLSLTPMPPVLRENDNYIFVEVCRRGWVDSARRMVELGITGDDIVSRVNPGHNALLQAVCAKGDHLPMVKFLLEHETLAGAALAAARQSVFGLTNAAASLGNCHIVDYFIKRGIVDAKSLQQEGMGVLRNMAATPGCDLGIFDRLLTIVADQVDTQQAVEFTTAAVVSRNYGGARTIIARCAGDAFACGDEKIPPQWRTCALETLKRAVHDGDVMLAKLAVHDMHLVARDIPKPDYRTLIEHGKARSQGELVALLKELQSKL